MVLKENVGIEWVESHPRAPNFIELQPAVLPLAETSGTCLGVLARSALNSLTRHTTV
jgi:hypothetical protein